MATRDEVRAKLAEYLRKHPDQTYRDIAAKLGCHYSTVANVAREYGVIRKERRLTPALTEEALNALEAAEPVQEVI